MSNKFKYGMWDLIARTVAVIPPIAAILYFFPEWIKRSPRATVSGTVVLAVLVCMIPFWKKLVELSKSLSSTGIPVFWLASGGAMYILKDIADRVFYICIFGFAGSLLSIAVCMFIRNRYLPSEGNKENKG
ncbi:MAG: hypothetical protein IJ002_03200 [Clostridia bacterium]|nr:hypothetical protein [Clostridia bacterium]MBQ8836499.1 hypothetical protein [Clostridia bacterium]